MIDKVHVYLEAGRGGDGCESFESRGYKKYFPIGGDGGKGGDIIIRADSNISDLTYFKHNPHQRAGTGGAGGNNQRKGSAGENLILRVPIGTVILDKYEGYVLRDLAQEGDEVLFALGGKPGRGNHDNRIPSRGEAGEHFDVIFNFKVTSDVVFIGMPNSGKTALLNALTRAKVHPVEFSFSTKGPQRGVIELEDYRHITVCDLPSLMRGSSEGKGIGNQFLKHAERTTVLCFVLAYLYKSHESLCDQYECLWDEISAYKLALQEKEQVIVINTGESIDESVIKKDKERLMKLCKNVYTISAVTGEGLDTFKNELGNIIPHV